MILEITYNDTNKKERFIVKETRCIVGRSPKATVQIDLECFSRNHFEIEWDGQSFYVTDLNSTNGVFVSGERLQPGTRTLFQNYFPLEVGGQISIFAFPDAGDEKIDDTETNPQFHLDIQKNQTRTKTTTSRKPFVSPPKKTEKKTPGIALIAPLVIGGTVFYFYNTYFKPEEVVAPVEVSQTTSTTMADRAPSITLDDASLKALIGKSQCADLGELCQNLKLSRAQEMVTIEQDKLIVFLNYPLFLTQMNSPYLVKVPDEMQREYAMANFALNPLLIEEARKKNLAYIVVVGMDAIDDFVQVKASMAVEIKKLPVITPADHKTLFSGLFHAGMFRNYKVYYKPFTKTTNY